MDWGRLSALTGIGLGLFAVTDIDDLFVLVAFFADRTFRPRQIVLGQYLGIAALIAASATSYFLRFVLPNEWIGLAGLVPIILGVKEALELRRELSASKAAGDDEAAHEADEAEEARGAARRFSGAARSLAVAAVTIANGGDNIGVYVPLFASSSPLEILLLALLFFGMTGVWLFIAWALVSNRLFGNHIRRVGKYVLPVVLIGLGVFIMWKQGTGRLLGLLGSPPA